MTIENILAKLSKVKKVHHGYKACCPVHDDSDPSMTITETEDGKVLCHCFACGARGTDVVEVLGLSTRELFSDDITFTPDPKRKLQKTELEDSIVISIYEKEKREGKYLTHSDYKRYKLAKARIEQLAS